MKQETRNKKPVENLRLYKKCTCTINCKEFSDNTVAYPFRPRDVSQFVHGNLRWTKKCFCCNFYALVTYLGTHFELIMNYDRTVLSHFWQKLYVKYSFAFAGKQPLVSTESATSWLSTSLRFP